MPSPTPSLDLPPGPCARLLWREVGPPLPAWQPGSPFLPPRLSAFLPALESSRGRAGTAWDQHTRQRVSVRGESASSKRSLSCLLV